MRILSHNDVTTRDGLVKYRVSYEQVSQQVSFDLQEISAGYNSIFFGGKFKL